jgi:hypothetical protein
LPPPAARANMPSFVHIDWQPLGNHEDLHDDHHTVPPDARPIR